MQLIFKVDTLNDNKSLLIFLKKSGVSTSYIKKSKNTKQGICVNGLRVHTNHIVHTGDAVGLELMPETEHLSAQPEDIALDISFKSDFAIVINKPAFMTMYQTMNYNTGTLANAFSFYVKDWQDKIAFRPVNRLDRNTSGLVLAAANSLSVPFLFASVKKEYIAIVEGVITQKQGTITKKIGVEENSIIKRCITDEGKESITHFEVLHTTQDFSVVKLKLETGRTHQIRVHMASMGHPLLGDDLYGGSTKLINRHALHCLHIDFTQPNGEFVQVDSPLPDDMMKILGENHIINLR